MVVELKNQHKKQETVPVTAVHSLNKKTEAPLLYVADRIDEFLSEVEVSQTASCKVQISRRDNRSYGNVRITFAGSDKEVVMLTLVYELPGGSSDMHLITDYKQFMYGLDRKAEPPEERTFTDADEVLDRFLDIIKKIKERRLHAINTELETIFAQKGSPMDRCVRAVHWLTDLHFAPRPIYPPQKGGSISYEEFIHGSQYISSLLKAQISAVPDSF